jgi:5'-nucleotidase
MRPRVLVSNDDGVVAPGLRALAHELNMQDFCEFAVSGPSGERSAQSHCITIGKHLHAFNIEVEGASEAFAVVSDLDLKYRKTHM